MTEIIKVEIEHLIFCIGLIYFMIALLFTERNDGSDSDSRYVYLLDEDEPREQGKTPREQMEVSDEGEGNEQNEDESKEQIEVSNEGEKGNTSIERDVLTKGLKSHSSSVKELYVGNWFSTLYPKEKGTIMINLITRDGIKGAIVKIFYDENSEFNAENTSIIICHCYEDTDGKGYFIRQRKSHDDQFFLFSFKKDIVTNPIGQYVCIRPSDVGEIQFDQDECTYLED